MIPRYSLAPMAALFTDEARYRAWLEVEILATAGQAEVGVVPKSAATAISDRADFTVAEIEAREQVTEHDVAAFVDVVQAHIGEPARHGHAEELEAGAGNQIGAVILHGE